jgi:hypothetical protein
LPGTASDSFVVALTVNVAACALPGTVNKPRTRTQAREDMDMRKNS